MIINYKKLDTSDKVVQFLEGVFQIETDKKFSWIWTTTKVCGVVLNAETITIKAFSEIDNILLYNDHQMEIKSDCLNIIKLNTSQKSQFKFELLNAYNAINDNRNLGLRIIGILVDEEVIF